MATLYLAISERGSGERAPLFASADQGLIRAVGELIARRLGAGTPRELGLLARGDTKVPHAADPEESSPPRPR